jgi:hypothetical protein
MLMGSANHFALIWHISQLLIWAVYLALDLAYILWAQKGQHESWWCPKTRAKKKQITQKIILISSRVSLPERWSLGKHSFGNLVYAFLGREPYTALDFSVASYFSVRPEANGFCLKGAFGKTHFR